MVLCSSEDVNYKCNYYFGVYGFVTRFKENYLKSGDFWNKFVDLVIKNWYTPRFNVQDVRGDPYTFNIRKEDVNVLKCPKNPANYSRILNWYGEFDQNNKTFKLRAFTSDNESYPVGIYEFFQDPLMFIDGVRHALCMLSYSIPEEPHNALEYDLNRFAINIRRGFLNSMYHNETSQFSAEYHTNRNTRILENIYCDYQHCQYFANNLSLAGFEITAGIKGRVIRDGVKALQDYFKGLIDSECSSNSSSALGSFYSSTEEVMTTGSTVAVLISLILNVFLLVRSLRFSRRIEKLELAQSGLDDTALLGQDQQSQSASISSIA